MDNIEDRLNHEEVSRCRGYGFTLVETLIVVAILIIIMGVGFIALMHWRTEMRQLEFDATAKEIYMAAQNHLSYAESQGLLEEWDASTSTYVFSPGEGILPYNKLSDGTPLDEVYYFVHGSIHNPTETNVLGLMLPFGAIDETVRVGGSYFICYQHSTATVLEVFYTADGNLSDIEDVYSSMMSYRGPDKKDDRKEIPINGKSTIVGYFNGEGTSTGIKLKAPTVQVENGDVLKIIVTNPKSNQTAINRYNTSHSTSASLKLKVQIEQEGSASKLVIDLYPLGRYPVNPYVYKSRANGESYTIVLDDITTSGECFHKQVAADHGYPAYAVSGTFDSGKNINVFAWVEGDGVVAGLARSATTSTNSLFADRKTIDGKDTVYISNYRHLENLCTKVSGFSDSINAIQTTNLSWPKYVTSIKNWTIEYTGSSKQYITIYGYDSVALTPNDSENEGFFFPITLNNKLVYDGASHRISDVKIDASTRISNNNNPAEYAGIFGRLATNGSQIKNVEVIDALISGNGNPTGVLLGQMQNGTSVENVLVRASLTNAAIGTKRIIGEGVTGGLIGSMDGGIVQYCASAIYVEGASDTGGLIGQANGGEIKWSYSGGHTGRKEERGSTTYDSTLAGTYSAPDVKSSGTAGGLVGSATGTSITKCYSTCSVQGATAGGLAGTLSGTGSVDGCYVTGKVTAPSGTTGTLGAFAGSISDGITGTNYYYEIINIPEPEAGSTEQPEPLGPFSGVKTNNRAVPFDAMDRLSTIYTGGSTNSDPAIPYDSVLASRYVSSGSTRKSLYALKTIKGLLGTDYDSDDSLNGSFTEHLTRHYGDWPMPETLVINTPSS